MLAKFPSFARDLWRLLTPYWKSEERWKSGALLVVIIALNLGSVYLSVLFNHWNNDFYNTLQDKNIEGFWHQLGKFGYLATSFIVVAVLQFYLQQALQLRWRRWLTADAIQRWTSHKAYYRLQMSSGRASNAITDNPDQRIAEDIHNFIQQTLSLGLDFMNSVVTLFSFATILWGLSGAITLGGFAIPGYMLWAALLYAIVGTGLTHWIGRPLINLNFLRQRYEADFRFSLIRVRENAEGIALYNGEHEEQTSLKARFTTLYSTLWKLIGRQQRLIWFTQGYNQIAVVFPYVVAGTRYFTGELTLGSLMQTADAFGQVQNALSWFLNAYTSLADWAATVERLTGFNRAIEATVALQPEDAEHSLHDGSTALELSHVSIHLPDGRSLIKDLSLTLAPGSRTLITGPSGCGKSTLFRLIGGLWPYWQGTASVPDRAASLFLPQKPYLPIASLRTTLAYPDTAEHHSNAAMTEVLEAVGLSALAPELDSVQHWAQRLSPGEQQRLAFARALLLKPRWLFLDEATSALDEQAEKTLYAHLIAALPTTAIVSIAHHAAIADLHEQQPALAWG